MLTNLKQTLRRRLLGSRFLQTLLDDHLAINRTANLAWMSGSPGLKAESFSPPFNEYEFSRYSQNGEDGLILYLLSRLGVGSRYMIEIGIQDGRECNSSNLVMNFGWCACVIEADNNWAMQAENFYCHQGVRDRVRLVNVAATPENINGLLSGAAVPPGSEVLSIDIDSYDYWLWKAVDAMVPPLVVIEYNASFGPTRSVTVPYSEPFTALSRYYHGASITALNRLGKSKGYILAGCDSKGVNAFFVKMDLAANAGIKAVEPASAFRPHYRRTRKMTVEQQYRTMASLPLEEV